MIDEIMEAYHGIIEEADFLSDETRAKAIEKLDSITPNVLYPDSWEKYSCEELNFAGPEDGGTLWEANRRIARYMRDESVKEYSEPVDKEEWGDWIRRSGAIRLRLSTASTILSTTASTSSVHMHRAACITVK